MIEKQNDYIVHLKQFDGPLDVLLFLIQKTKVNIMDISISEITDQYVAYLQSLQDLNLEVASEYLLLSAQLIEMKSKMLLPRPKVTEEDEEDPREALIQRLLEYKKYKEAAKALKTYEMERQQVFAKPLSNLSGLMHHQTTLNYADKKDVYQLVQAFERMLVRQKNTLDRQVTLTKNELTIEDQMARIEAVLHKEKKLALSALTAKKNRRYVVTTFLAILQLLFMHKVNVVQDELFGDIEISAA